MIGCILTVGSLALLNLFSKHARMANASRKNRTGPAANAVTLADVASRAGVSRAAASMGLRGSPEISLATQKRLKEAAAELHYRPDPVLAALVARRRQRRASANLGVIIDERWGDTKTQGWLRSCLDGMRAAAVRFGYALSELRLEQDLAAWKNPDRVLAGRGVGGLVVLPFYGDKPGAMPVLDWSRYSMVTVGNPPLEGWHRVGTDAFAAMNLVCDQLRLRGIRRVGLVQSLWTERRLRFEWLGALAKEWHRPGADFQAVPSCLPEVLDERGFGEWFRIERPEVVVGNDARVIDWLATLRVRVPEDVGVVLLNRDFSGRPDACGISQHLDEVGHAAVELMHGLMLRGERGTPEVRREVLVLPHWSEGATLRTVARIGG